MLFPKNMSTTLLKFFEPVPKEYNIYVCLATVYNYFSTNMYFKLSEM